jgi:hypothetical protein
MGFRYPTSRCRSLPELEDRVRELVRQLEPVILENRIIETTETAVAHGLGEVPGWIGWDPPHCVAVVRQTRAPDHRNVYLRATTRCVVNVRVLRACPLLPGQMPNGGFTLPDWDVGAESDHKVATDATDEAAGGADYLLAKHANTGNVTFSLDTSGGQRRVAASASIPSQSLAPVVALCGRQEAAGLTGWTFGLAGPGIWSRDANGALGPDGWTDYVTINTNDRIFVSTVYSSDTVLEYVHAGPYDVLNAGSPTTQALIRRSADADASAEFVAGMSVAITGGMDWAGRTLFLLNPPIVLETTVQRWGISPTGTAAHTHAWSDLRPEGMAKVPFPEATLVEIGAGGGDGKLALGDSNRYLVDPAGFSLCQIQTPTVDAGTTVEITLVFTAPILVVPNVAPDTGYSTLHLVADAAITGTEFPNAYASMTFIYVAGLSAWLELEEHET